MAIHNYLDKTGLSQLWEKAKAAFADKITTQTELDKKFELPSGGSNGQILAKASSGVRWSDVPEPDIPQASETAYGTVKFVSDSDFDAYMGITTAQSLAAKVSSLNTRVGVVESKIAINDATQESGA